MERAHFRWTNSASDLSFADVVPIALPGDYNGDGIVDAADYTRWRNNLGSTTTLLNDDTSGVGAGRLHALDNPFRPNRRQRCRFHDDLVQSGCVWSPNQVFLFWPWRRLA